MVHSAKRKAVFATVAFTIFGMIFAAAVKNPTYSLPAFVFYAGIVINTYFSIRCFSSITPKNNRVVDIVDIGLAVLYLALASSFGDIQRFLTIALFLFELAVIKYNMLLGVSASEYRNLVQKKILIDMLGVISCSIALALALLGYPSFSIWFLALLMTVANIYLLILRPFYTID